MGPLARSGLSRERMLLGIPVFLIAHIFERVLKIPQILFINNHFNIISYFSISFCRFNCFVFTFI